jgi:hypothetical protein
VAHSLAAFATTIALLWKGRQHKVRAFFRTAAEGGLYFKSGIGWMSDIIAYITRSTESAWHTCHFTSTYRAVLRSELRDILEQAGFTNVRWLLPSDSDFYQPIFIASRNR